MGGLGVNDMYKKNKMSVGGLKINESLEGETIEQKIERIVQNKEAIKDGAPLIYTERKDGVKAGHNIRTDRFEVAVEAMDYVTRSTLAKRDNVAKMEIVKNDNISEAESAQGTNN